MSHDAESVLLAPDARRINNGRTSVEGAEALRAIIRREPAARTAAFRWIVDGEDAITFYDLDADMAIARGEPAGPPERWIPTTIAERFRVRNERIEEIEVVYSASAPGTPRAERPERYAEGSDEPTIVRQAARAYLDALVSHDASAVPLAERAWRIENGKETGDGREVLRAALESDAMRSVLGIDDERWWIAGDSAVVFYTLRAKAGDEELPMAIAERFRVVGGELVEIEAVFAPHEGER